MQKIIIIGGGLSGTLLTINLLRNHFQQSLDITIIEKNAPHLMGAAYSTDKDFHLLNVQAGKMSAFADKPDDFINWLSASGYNFQGTSFVPRMIYKKYVQELLQTELANKTKSISYKFMQEKAIDILSPGNIVLLGSGKMISFDKLILALGNFSPTHLKLNDQQYLGHPAYFSSAWERHLFDNITHKQKVLILGTGLSMVDTVLGLQTQHHAGEIVALSTHGFIPVPHRNVTFCQLKEEKLLKINTALDALKMVNQQIKHGKTQDTSWEAVVDAIRPFTQRIWMNLPCSEKKKFMEHLRHIWGVSRHRIPAECATTIHQLLSQKQLSIIAGRIRSIQVTTENRFSVTYHERLSKKAVPLVADVIVNCMGPESNYNKIDDPLIKNLLKKGMIRTDEMRLGIDCTPDGVVIKSDGSRSSSLYTIGPPAKGTLWEITSVPEIRTAALKLAEVVTSNKEFAY